MKRGKAIGNSEYKWHNPYRSADGFCELYLTLTVIQRSVYMILLEINHIKHYVRDRLLLDVNNLQIHDHDKIGLIGPNGCGKTTLLNIMAGTINPNNGKVTRYAKIELIPQIKQQAGTTKSGGEVTKEYLQQVLYRHPSLLLADEPTTNLDTDHIEWLEKILSEWKGAFVIVSHDRDFLDSLCTTIWEIDGCKIIEYTGNYTNYKEQKEKKKLRNQLEYKKYMEKKKQLERAIIDLKHRAQRATKKPKNISNSEARVPGVKTHYASIQKKLMLNIKSIQKRIERLEVVEKEKELPPIKMELKNAELPRNKPILRVEDLSGIVGERVLWNKISFQIRVGDKLAIIGPNGSGKTTLIKKIINKDPKVKLSPSVKIGYFSQDLNILDDKKTILQNVWATSNHNETFIRTVLARMHFFGEDIYKPVEILSGGERVKAALAKIILSDVNMLVLDEPTNFLDAQAIEALETLLMNYEGSVIFASHDRRFINKVATRILSIRNGRIELFSGNYKEYKEYQQRQIQAKQDKERNERLLLLETKIAEVISRLSLNPSEELDRQLENLLSEKEKLIQKNFD